MAERRETNQYKIQYNKLLENLSSYKMTLEELNHYLYILETCIIDKVNKEGKIPQYSYIMNMNTPIIYESDNTPYLELMCSFEPIPEYMKDIVYTIPVEEFLINGNIYDRTVDNSIIFPSSASGRMNLETGEYDAIVSWEERFIEDYN